MYILDLADWVIFSEKSHYGFNAEPIFMGALYVKVVRMCSNHCVTEKNEVVGITGTQEQQRREGGGGGGGILRACFSLCHRTHYASAAAVAHSNYFCRGTTWCLVTRPKIRRIYFLDPQTIENALWAADVSFGWHVMLLPVRDVWEAVLMLWTVGPLKH